MSSEARTIRVDLAGRGYDIAIGPGLIDRAGELSRPLLAAPRVIVVSDQTVAPLYGARLAASFDKAGVRTASITVPAGLVSGLPVGISFIGPAWSEPRLIGLAHAFELARSGI